METPTSSRLESIQMYRKIYRSTLLFLGLLYSVPTFVVLYIVFIEKALDKGKIALILSFCLLLFLIPMFFTLRYYRRRRRQFFDFVEQGIEVSAAVLRYEKLDGINYLQVQWNQKKEQYTGRVQILKKNNWQSNSTIPLLVSPQNPHEFVALSPGLFPEIHYGEKSLQS